MEVRNERLSWKCRGYFRAQRSEVRSSGFTCTSSKSTSSLASDRPHAERRSAQQLARPPSSSAAIVAGVSRQEDPFFIGLHFCIWSLKYSVEAAVLPEEVKEKGSRQSPCEGNEFRSLRGPNVAFDGAHLPSLPNDDALQQ